MSHNSDVVKQGFAKLCEQVGSPYADRAIESFTLDETSLQNIEMPQPKSYQDAYSFANDYYVYSYVRKYVGLDVDVEKRADASYLKWEGSEEACYRTNQRFRRGEFSPSEERLFDRASETIAMILGEFSYEKVLSGCDIGPGSIVGFSRRTSQLGRKQLLPMTVTAPCLKFAKAWCENDLLISSLAGFATMLPTLSENFTVVQGGELLLVPKTSFIDRVIDKQPGWNLWFQKGVGHYIRRCLKRFGVDLDNQARNREAARKAFELGYATIDLVGASDCKAKLLIRRLLPRDWYEYLDDIRTTVTTYARPEYGQSEVLPLEKFSSMGNGFTFELETLVFLALLGPENVVSVYGDDIIVKQQYYGTATQILEMAGFTVNMEKSYADGPFFESCGGHYFQGVEVTPPFQKEVVVDPIHYVRAANRWYKAAFRAYGFFLEDSLEGSMYAYYVKAYTETVAEGDEEKVPYVPFPGDDRGFLTCDVAKFVQCCPNRGALCRVLTPRKGERRRGHQEGLYWHKLWDSTKRSTLDPRGSARVFEERCGYKLSRRWIQRLTA